MLRPVTLCVLTARRYILFDNKAFMPRYVEAIHAVNAAM